MAQHNSYSGRLYLAKGKEQIYVDVNNILQQQIEGIRFLYKQFKKKKPGVILNDPTSSGKTHQVALFLNAIKCLLNKPILILCGSHEQSHWLAHFDKLTDFGNGVMVEPLNLTAKGMSVCIDSKSNLTSLVTRDWSIVVIDDDSAINEVLKRVFKTEYKIWITSVDMKMNLEAYCKIFGWLCPQEKDRQNGTKKYVQNILTDCKDTQHSIEELILLDALMEDVVLRRKHGFSSFQPQNKIGVEINIPRKNKDLLGTKIKRSKKRTTGVSSISNTVKHSSLINEDSSFENNDKRDVDTEQMGIDENRDESVTNDENILIQHTDPIKLETNVLDVVECMSIDNESKDEVHNENKFGNDVSYDGKETRIGNDESSQIVIESNTLNSDNLKPNKSNVSECSEEIDDGNKIHTTDINKQLRSDINVETQNKRSPYKNIDEVIRETEENAMKKFKGSLLDSIF